MAAKVDDRRPFADNKSISFLPHLPKSAMIPNPVKLLVIVIAMTAIFWPGIQRHAELFNDPYFVPYDAVQYVPAFFKYEPVDPIPTTYLKEYYLDAICPPFYRWMTSVGARFVDVRQFQMAMMYLSYAVFIFIVGRLGWKLGGAALAFAMAALTVSAWIFIGLGFIGSAPRMYAYPVVAAILYALILDRPYILAGAVVVAALFYPVAALIGGACLAAWLLVPRFFKTGSVSAWPLGKRIKIVGLTGALTVALLLPLLLGGGYGRRVVASDIPAYPEAGAGGNYRAYDQLPYGIFGLELASYFIGPLYSHGDPVVPWLNVHKNSSGSMTLLILLASGLAAVFVILRGFRVWHQQGDPGASTRLLSFYAVCLLLHVLSWLFAPYLYIPARYFLLSLPFLIVIMVPFGLFLLLRQFPRLQTSPALHRSALLTLVAVYLALFSGRGNAQLADAFVQPAARPLFATIARLPKDVVVAGWPLGMLREFEYATRRNVFLTGELHMVLHLEFMKKMRERMDALFDAYFATDAAPIHNLREKFGVTHLIVETSHFSDPEKRPDYYAPWRSRIAPRLAEIKGKEYLLDRTLHERAAVFQQDGFVLLDLAKLP